MAEIICARENTALLFEISIFIGKNEKWCCSLFQKLLEGGSEVYAVREEEKLLGVFAFSGSTFFPYFPYSSKKIKTALEKFFSFHEVHCVSGKKESVSLVQKVLASMNETCVENRDMILMEKVQDSFFIPPSLPEGMSLVKCSISHADSLMPLQVSYSAEEVLPAGKKLYPYVERYVLEETLKKNCVLALKKNGDFIAKAHMTLGGSSCCQIGGVYTKPDFRGLGCASFLVYSLSLEAEKLGKKTSLFVRKKNFSAIYSYRRAGFKNQGAYKIAYY